MSGTSARQCKDRPSMPHHGPSRPEQGFRLAGQVCRVAVARLAGDASLEFFVEELHSQGQAHWTQAPAYFDEQKSAPRRGRMPGLFTGALPRGRSRAQEIGRQSLPFLAALVRLENYGRFGLVLRVPQIGVSPAVH